MHNSKFRGLTIDSDELSRKKAGSAFLSPDPSFCPSRVQKGVFGPLSTWVIQKKNKLTTPNLLNKREKKTPLFGILGVKLG